MSGVLEITYGWSSVTVSLLASFSSWENSAVCRLTPALMVPQYRYQKLLVVQGRSMRSKSRAVSVALSTMA